MWIKSWIQMNNCTLLKGFADVFGFLVSEGYHGAGCWKVCGFHSNGNSTTLFSYLLNESV